MTLDEAFMLLVDKRNLRVGQEKIRSVDGLEVTTISNADGTINGRAADGTKIVAKIKGKSLAQKLREEEEQRLADLKATELAQQQQPKRRGRRR
jgi:hypothetical protein